MRADLEARVARELAGSEVFVSIGQLRQVAVFVGGEVNRPGMVVLSPLATVLDALMAAGGPRRTGSLRAIRVGGRIVDLYPVISGDGGSQPDLRILEGDRVVVPPVGAVAAIGGEVSRPGIYELPAGANAAPLSVMLGMAGNALRPSGNRFLLETTDNTGRRAFREIGPRDSLRRGDALLVQPGVDAQAGGLRALGPRRHAADPRRRRPRCHPARPRQRPAHAAARPLYPHGADLARRRAHPRPPPGALRPGQAAFRRAGHQAAGE